MLGTYTVALDSVVAWLMTLVMVISFLYFMNRREKRQAEESRVKREAERAKDELHQKRVQQTNVGNRIFNFLKNSLEPYAEAGIRVLKINPNGDSYSVHVVHDDGHIIQISARYIEGSDKPIHVHKGAYGYDVWFMGDDAHVLNAMNWVFDEVKREVRAHPHWVKEPQLT